MFRIEGLTLYSGETPVLENNVSRDIVSQYVCHPGVVCPQL